MFSTAYGVLRRQGLQILIGCADRRVATNVYRGRTGQMVRTFQRSFVMLDAFKSLTGGNGKAVQSQADELQALISTAREERSAISAMLNALTTRGAKLTPLTKQLEQVTDRATAITDKLDDVAKRLATLDNRTRELEEVDKRIQALKDAAKQAEVTTQRAIGPDG